VVLGLEGDTGLGSEHVDGWVGGEAGSSALFCIQRIGIEDSRRELFAMYKNWSEDCV